MQALWMVLAAFFFATMAVGIKIASADFSTSELVFYRGVVSVVFMAVVMRTKKVPLITPVPWMHAWRSVIGVFSLASWFFAIAHLPLATAMTLNYMSGVWVAAFVVGGALLYGQSARQGPLMATVLAGFAGVVMMLRPTLDQNQLFAGLVGLLSGMGAALAYLQVTALGKVGEPESRTVFYFSVGTTVAGLMGVAWSGFTLWWSVVHDPRLQPWCHAAGGQFAIHRHHLRRDLQLAAVWRRTPADRLGWHGTDCGKRRGRHRAAHPRPAQYTGRRPLTH